MCRPIIINLSTTHTKNDVVVYFVRIHMKIMKVLDNQIFLYDSKTSIICVCPVSDFENLNINVDNVNNVNSGRYSLSNIDKNTSEKSS